LSIIDNSAKSKKELIIQEAYSLLLVRSRQNFAEYRCISIISLVFYCTYYSELIDRSLSNLLFIIIVMGLQGIVLSCLIDTNSLTKTKTFFCSFEITFLTTLKLSNCGKPTKLRGFSSFTCFLSRMSVLSCDKLTKASMVVILLPDKTRT
jgi:hypothetical protein